MAVCIGSRGQRFEPRRIAKPNSQSSLRQSRLLIVPLIVYLAITALKLAVWLAERLLKVMLGGVTIKKGELIETV